jgi:hypothetical protein
VPKSICSYSKVIGDREVLGCCLVLRWSRAGLQARENWGYSILREGHERQSRFGKHIDTEGVSRRLRSFCWDMKWCWWRRSRKDMRAFGTLKGPQTERVLSLRLADFRRRF